MVNQPALQGRSAHALRMSLVVALLGGTMSAVPGWAQAGSVEGPVLEDVVVTATRNRESLSKIAASVTAIGADQLGPGGATEIQSLAQKVPNLSVGDQFGVNRAFIRGIGLTSIDLGADGAVAFLQDGAAIARPAAQLSGFYDIERVEVLRGPQGTLYGRGATAGAINLITKRPTAEFGGYGRATYGNYNAVTLEGAVSGPLVADKLMVRVAGKYDRRDGYGVNQITGNDIDNRDAWALRGSLLYTPTDRFEIYITAEHFEEDDNNYAFHYFGPTVAPENQLGAILGGDTIITRAQRLGISVNLRDIVSDQEPLNKRDGTAVTGIMTWSPGDWELKSITAWRDFTRFNRTDLDASDVWMFGQNNYDEESTTFQQELIGTWSNDRFDLLLGATYFNEKLYGSVRVPLVNLGILFGLPANTFDNQNYWQQGNVYIDAYGAFVQGTYAVTDKLKLTAGIRYSYEERKGVGTFDFLGTVSTDKQKGWGAWTPTVAAKYQVNDNTMLYASITRGFKSGVINVGSQNDVIDPEYVWGYEAGIKTIALDGTLSASLAGFYMDYSDLQVGFVGADSVVTTVNAASARNYGAELELRARPAEGLTFEIFGTWLDARYTEFVSGDYRQGFAPVDLSGNKLSNAPEFTIRVAGDYDIPVGDSGVVNLRADINFQDEVFFTEFNNRDAYQPATVTINAGVRFSSADNRWSIDLWGRNLTDEFIITNNIITAPLFNSVRVGSLAPPRTFGATVGFNF
jgi:iron complex outermembrane recepter protein